MTISCHEQSMIYDCTKAQSSSMTWFEQRIGHVSSFVVHRVLHTSIEKPSTSLLMQICNPSTAPINTPPILWGRQQEQVVLKEYSQIVSPEHHKFSITKTGFLIDQEHPFIGVSADSISTCECHGKRVVEVKCPYKHRDNTYQDFIADPNCCIYDRNKLKLSHPYYSQVQLQMYVHDVSNCDCVVWATNFLVVCHVNRDNVFIKNMISQTKSFFVMCILPELLTRKLQHITVQKKDIVSKDNLYCICQTPEDGDMIGCDNVNCKYQ